MCDCPGSSFGGRIGSKLGAAAGDYAQNFASKQFKRFKNWTGFGDYRIASNSLVTGQMSPSSEPIIQTRGRSTTVMYREYLGDVSTHPTVVGAFNAITYPVNPGNAGTFPWLSNIALQYEQYKPKGILFEFRSTATDTTTNASLGSIMMSSEYDAKDQNPDSKAQMLMSAYSSETKMTNGLLHGIECDPEELQRNIFYVRPIQSELVLSAEDQMDYEVCRTTIATQGGGLPAGQSVGSLWIHYEFEFFKEQINEVNEFPYFANYYGLNSLATNNLSDFGLSRNQGYEFGIEFTTNGIIFPKIWAGKTFIFTFGFSTTVAYITATADISWTTSGCSVVSYPNNMRGGLAQGIWQLRAPPSGVTQTSSAAAMGQFAFKLNDVLLVDATATNAGNWGIWIASCTGTRQLYVQIQCQRDFAEQRV